MYILFDTKIKRLKEKIKIFKETSWSKIYEQEIQDMEDIISLAEMLFEVKKRYQKRCGQLTATNWDLERQIKYMSSLLKNNVD